MTSEKLFHEEEHGYVSTATAEDLFDVGEPVAVVPPPEFPPEKPPVVEPDRTQAIEFEPPLAGATISPCGRYRYTLWRKFKNKGSRLMWIMLNPSTANAVDDDPTIRRLISFSKREGAAEMFVVNLFAYRAADPKDLRIVSKVGNDIAGPLNRETVERILYDSDTCIVAWGNGGSMHRAGREMKKLLDEFNNKLCSLDRVPVVCLGVTKHGHPKHPLYVAANKALTPFHYGDITDDGCDL